MKKLILTFAAISMLCAAAHSAPASPYVGVYADAAHSLTSVHPPLYTFFDAWVWWLPSESGLMAVEYAFALPPYVVATAMSLNPNPICLVIDDCCSMSYCTSVFMDCQMDWIWTLRLTCMTLSLDPGTISIGPTQYGAPCAANCTPGYPKEDAIILDALGINQEGVIGVDESTWGAIKSLYR